MAVLCVAEQGREVPEGEGGSVGNPGAATERLQGTVKAVGGRSLAVGNAVGVGAGDGEWGFPQDRGRAGVLGGRGVYITVRCPRPLTVCPVRPISYSLFSN